jgi:serine/threonine protein kinase
MDPLLIILIALIAVIVVAVVIVVALLLRRPNTTGYTGPLTESVPQAEILVVLGTRKGQRIQFRGNEIAIGRDASCGVQLDEPLVSRFHATIRFESGHYTLLDTNSANGVVMNGQRVFQTVLQPGMQFDIGQTRLALIEPGSVVNAELVAPPPPSVNVNSELHAPPGYDLGSRVDKGGQATVYRGTHQSDGAAVVIKFLNNMSYNTGGMYFRTKFEQQILIGASIRHPHCVQIIGGDAAADPPYMIEEYLSGGSLYERMRSYSLPDNELVRVIGEVCDALLYLHQRGIIHRDISPKNIMFDDRNQTRLIDFGIARFTSAPTRSDLGLKAGVAMYMSPEQARGDSNKISPQSDIYSLGILTYELFVHRPPFEGNDLDVLTHQLKTIPPAPSQVNNNVSPALSNAIMRALEKDPARRYGNAEEMARAFGYSVPFNAGAVDVSRVNNIKGNTIWKGSVVRPIRLQVVDTGAYLPVNANPLVFTREMVNRDDHTMSRRHGQVYFKDNFWWIAELEDKVSANGIFHNDVRVSEPHVLTLGDVIRLGKTSLKVVD